MNEAKTERAADGVHVGCFPPSRARQLVPHAAATAVAVQGRWVASPSLAGEKGGADPTHHTQRENSSMKA